MGNAIEIDGLIAGLSTAGYLADRGLATALACSIALSRGLLLEGDAGVGKTEAARALADFLGARLIRLQCYEGLDLYSAGYDWNYGKQLLAIRTSEAVHERPPDLYSRDFLIRRPLLAALDGAAPRSIVLLIDELDRADDEFEAFLLEYLQDFAMSIPEIGKVAAVHPPIVVVTSNRTRDLHDALKRRCFYHWIGHPSLEREIEILRLRLPHLSSALAGDVARAIAALRQRELRKTPGIAEALDWAQALQVLGAERIDRAHFNDSLGSVLKYPEDIDTAQHGADEIIAAARTGDRA